MAGSLNTLANCLWALAPGSGKKLEHNDVFLVAHRGAHDAGAGLTENTLPAFQRCLEMNVRGVEMDIRLTRDNEPVIHHDAHCGRLFGRPDIVIHETDYALLRSDLPQVPHLEEIISRYGGRLHLMLEIKESWRERPLLVDAISERLAAIEPCADFHLLSLEPDHLEGFTSIPAAAYMDVAQTNTNAILKQTLTLGHGAMAGSFALIGAQQLRRLRDAGCRVGTGMVTRQRILQREVSRGVDWVFTDNIERLQALLPR